MWSSEETKLNLATLGKMGRSSLHKLRVQFTIDLHPSKSGNIQAGVVEQLNNMLLRSVLQRQMVV
jgi:hypothetical protein